MICEKFMLYTYLYFQRRTENRFLVGGGGGGGEAESLKKSLGESRPLETPLKPIMNQLIQWVSGSARKKMQFYVKF